MPTEYIIRQENGVHFVELKEYRTSHMLLSTFVSALKQQQVSEPICIKDVTETESHQWSLVATGAQCTYFTPISHLIFNDMIVAPAWISPSFGRAESMRQRCVWNVPTDMMLLFALVNFKTAYLLAFEKQKYQCYKLPMANVYPDGRVCMGNHFDSEIANKRGTIHKLDYAIQDFYATDYNHDLRPDYSKSDVTFRFEPAGTENFNQLPSPWESGSSVISNSVIDMVRHAITQTS